LSEEKRSERSNIDDEITRIKKRLKDLEENPYDLNSPEDLERLERETLGLTRRLSDLIVKRKLQERMDSEKGRQEEKIFAKSMPRRSKNEGVREVRVNLMGGSEIDLQVPYYWLKGSGKGFYPGLWLLGIHEHASPGLLSMVGQMVSCASSLVEAQYLLEQHGCHLNIKTIQKIAKGISQRVKLRQRFGAVDLGTTVNGQRVIIATDGGRIRIREKNVAQRVQKDVTDTNHHGENPSF